MIPGRDLSIGQRLGLGFALLFVVLAALAGTIYHFQARSNAAQDDFVQRIAPLSQRAQEVESALLQTGISARAYLLRRDAASLQLHQQRIVQTRAALERLRALPKSEGGEVLLARVVPLVARYLDTAGQVGGEAPESALAEAREAAVTALEDFSALQRRHADEALARIYEASVGAGRALAVASTLALILFGVLALLIARSVREPARGLLGVARAMQAGDWKPALGWAASADQQAPALRDEMRQLGHAFGAAATALERREQRLRADREVAGAAAASLDRHEIAASALHAVCSHVGAEVGAFYWRENDSLDPIALRALGGTLKRLRIGDGIPGQAAADLRTVVVRSIPAESPFTVKLGYDAAPPRCAVAVPVAFRGELLGVLLVASLRELDAEAIGFLEAAASQLGVGLENVKAYEKIRQLLSEIEQKSELLQAQNEELQAQTEEIQAQNEELQAQGEEIQAQNEELQGQAQQLKAYADSLMEADRRKSEFLGILAHELRNPMAAIAVSLHTLANSAKAEHRGRAQEVIGRQTRLLSRLVDDLLDVTRIASGKVRLQKETMALADLVHECTEDYRPAADKAGVRLELSVPSQEVEVDGDRTRLCQIVGNLIDNAVKFSGQGGHITVALRTVSGRAEISVADHGIGMDGEMLARLFEPFSQADTSLARRKSGLGLGLALTKALAELHGGSVEARSDGLGKGSEFIVRLPLAARARRIARAQVRQPAPTGVPRRILIVEDNYDAGLTLRDAMEDAGHQVRIAGDAEEALAALAEFDADVLLCDIGLPGMDGYSLARTLRNDARHRNLFMIAVTGYAGPDDQQRAAQAGFDRHFRKPPDLELLCQLLNEVPSRSSQTTAAGHGPSQD